MGASRSPAPPRLRGARRAFRRNRAPRARRGGALQAERGPRMVEVGQPRLFDAPSAFLTLADRFLVPPFSVLEARAGYWQERKNQWLALGIRGEVGRGERLTGALQDAQIGQQSYAQSGIHSGARAPRRRRPHPHPQLPSRPRRPGLDARRHRSDHLRPRRPRTPAGVLPRARTAPRRMSRAAKA